MEQISQMNELARRVEEHNQLSDRARRLWTQAQETSQKIGTLVGEALRLGISWHDLSALLATMDAAAPPEGLTPGPTSDGGPLKGQRTPNGNAPVVPAQAGKKTAQQPHATNEEEGVPALLTRAYAVVAAVPEQEMASRDLAVALGRNPNTIGPDLCGLLRAVGVTRPNRGKIKARYGGGPAGSHLPGFTAACLKRAVEAYTARATPPATEPLAAPWGSASAHHDASAPAKASS